MRGSAHHCTRVPDSEDNDARDEKPIDGPVPIRESHGGEATEGVHGRLGPLVHWVHSRSLFPHVRHQNNFVDDPGEENERLVAPEVRGLGYLEDA